MMYMGTIDAKDSLEIRTHRKGNWAYNGWRKLTLIFLSGTEPTLYVYSFFLMSDEGIYLTTFDVCKLS